MSYESEGEAGDAGMFAYRGNDMKRTTDVFAGVPLPKFENSVFDMKYSAADE